MLVLPHTWVFSPGRENKIRKQYFSVEKALPTKANFGNRVQRRRKAIFSVEANSKKRTWFFKKGPFTKLPFCNRDCFQSKYLGISKKKVMTFNRFTKSLFSSQKHSDLWKKRSSQNLIIAKSFDFCPNYKLEIWTRVKAFTFNRSNILSSFKFRFVVDFSFERFSGQM